MNENHGELSPRSSRVGTPGYTTLSHIIIILQIYLWWQFIYFPIRFTVVYLKFENVKFETSFHPAGGIVAFRHFEAPGRNPAVLRKSKLFRYWIPHISIDFERERDLNRSKIKVIYASTSYPRVCLGDCSPHSTSCRCAPSHRFRCGSTRSRWTYQKLRSKAAVVVVCPSPLSLKHNQII